MAKVYWIKIEGHARYSFRPGTSRAAAEAEAQRIATRSGRRVTVGYTEKKARKIPSRKMEVRRNPDPYAFIDVWAMQLREAAAKADRSKAKKPRRLAKHDRARKASTSTPSHTRESTASGKYVVEARQGGEHWRFIRSTKAAALQLAQQMADRGLKPTVREA